MSKKLNLALINSDKEQKQMNELTKHQMNCTTAGGSDTNMLVECCLMFCKVSDDADGELDWFFIDS